MKIMWKFFALKILMVAFCMFVAAPICAQDLEKECGSIYQEFLANRRSQEFDKLKKAFADGKKYLEKCSDLKDNEAVRDYVTKEVSRLGTVVNPPPSRLPLVENFNSSVPAKNWDEAFVNGKKIIQNDPDALDVSLILASIGYDNATANPPNDKYNDEAITYAKLAQQQMLEGKSSGTGRFGAFAYIYKTKECTNGKFNATGWMNYIIGYIMYVRQKQTNAAIPYLYQATQIGCETKNFSEAYKLIGDWYFDEFKKTDSLALQRGYANRALDAYARAYKITTQNPKSVGKDSLILKIEQLYRIVPNSKAMNEYLKSVTETPFIDPATPVSPLPKNEQ